MKEKFPESEIHYLTKSNYKEIASLIPLLNQHIFFDSLIRDRKLIKKENYDLIIDLHKNFRSYFLSFMNGGKILRYRKDNLKKFLLVRFKINLFKDVTPVYKKYLLAVKEYLSEVDYAFSQTELTFEKTRFLKEDYIVISPSSRHFTKTYPADKFIIYINELNELNNLEKTTKIVLVGDDSENDKRICDYISERCVNVINLCGKLSISNLANVLYNSEYVVCNDSAVLHLSEALGKNVIAIFGSTVKEFGFFPQIKLSRVLQNKNLKCRPCTHIGRDSCPKGHFKCMQEIQLAISS